MKLRNLVLTAAIISSPSLAGEIHPGYVLGNPSPLWYRGMNEITAPAPVNLTANQIICSPFVIGNKPDGTSWTLSGDTMGTWITSPAPGHLGLAIYNNGSSGLPVSVNYATGQISTSVGGAATGQNPGFTLVSGIYWRCINADNSAAKVVATAVGVNAGYIGSSNLSDIVNGTSVMGAIKAPWTFSTWPDGAALGGLHWSPVKTTFPMSAFLIDSSAQ